VLIREAGPWSGFPQLAVGTASRALMRILHVIQELGFGGAERVVAALVRGSRARGHEVAVAAARGVRSDELDAEIFRVPMVHRRLSRLPLAAREVARARQAFQPDLVHAHNPGMAAAAALATRRGRRPPGLATMHGVPDEDYARAARVLRFAGLPVVACGPGVAAALEEHSCRVTATIVNGVGAPPQPADRDAVEREWGIAPKTPLLLTVGRLVEQKNHRLAIQALAHVPEAVLVIVGEGPLGEALEGHSSEAGVEDRVIFAGVRDDARAIVGAADALIVSSHWEGLPLVALEALAAGTPLVATAVRGIRELVTHEQNCLLVPPGDAGALGEALVRILADPALRQELSAAGLVLASSYSEEAMVARFLELYERLTRGWNHNGRGHELAL
jgi:glycosyltransferase involved in cell wall biosynthesis